MFIYNAFMNQLLKEIQIRLFWVFICLFLTYGICYWFSEDLFFILSKPYLKVSKISFFICTQITESLNTYLLLSIILGSFASAPYILYQLWCFFIPSSNNTQRNFILKLFFRSMFSFLIINIITFLWILPAIWSFLYTLSNTQSETQLFIIKLQPKIYDFSLLTLKIFIATSFCSQIPILLIYTIQHKLILIKSLLQTRKIFFFAAILFAAVIAPPDIWCQLLIGFSIFLCFEFAIFLSIMEQTYFKKIHRSS